MRRREYEQLKVLLRRAEFCQWSGLSDHDLTTAVEAGLVKPWRRPLTTYRRNGRKYRPKRSYCLYPKSMLLQFNPIED